MAGAWAPSTTEITPRLRASAHNSLAGRTNPVGDRTWLKNSTRVLGVIARTAASTISPASEVMVGRGNVLIVSPCLWPQRCQHQIMAPYSWSVIRISPGDDRRSPEATRLIAAETLVVKIKRCGAVPR